VVNQLLLCDMDVSNAFNNPTSGKIDQQRKILEELERQKKILAKSGSSSSLGMPPAAAEGSGPRQQQQAPALEAAHKTSLGYFIHQESAFGNVILPVIPRIPKPQK